MTKRMMNRYKVHPDNLDLDPKVYEIMDEARAKDLTVQQTFDMLVAEGFEPEASRWVVKLFAVIDAGLASAAIH